MDKREVTSSESRGNMVISVKGLTTSLNPKTGSPNKKQKARIAITDITNQYFRTLLREFKTFTLSRFKNKGVYNVPTDAYLLLSNHISKLIKIKKHVWL